ncbi:sn-1,2-diacylglycerol cholinephosphotransferase [Hesseltinella vesiculosa]|uniref:sn-1,2-diacylglycerol cholinephosphotransferase n=1 Tax=Hesseltinella vesiculosa TaxID=101127 RepID=A0A1X2GWM5_9FUNG|nr:sn-1,2-diacylglycerol cholinephosphotransferase [Hesseltinella vesiculosa]
MSLATKLREWLETDFPSHDQMENLRYYKYAAVDKSYLTKYVLRHYWNWAITLFPMWIAPNLITLIGLFFMIFNVLLVALYVPEFGTDAPGWIYLSFAIGLWLYSTFDNVDGKQARRTGSSSPLGELFDHGCDALNTTYLVVLQLAALGLGQTPSLMVVFAVTTMAGFYMSTAEEYYTGVLYLGVVNGPTEGIVITCLGFLWSWLYGAASWHVPLDTVSSVSWLATFLPNGTTAAQLLVWSTFGLFIFMHCPAVAMSVYEACMKKRLAPGEVAMTSFLPMAIFALAQYYWAMSPDSIVMVDHHFFLFVLANGTLFGFMVSSIIFAHLTKSPFPNITALATPVVVMAVLVNAPSIIGIRLLPPSLELVILWLEWIVCTVVYGVWAVLVIDGFCDYLGIRCLVIPAHKPIDDALVAAEQGDASPSSNESQYRTFT